MANCTSTAAQYEYCGVNTVCAAALLAAFDCLTAFLLRYYILRKERVIVLTLLTFTYSTDNSCALDLNVCNVVQNMQSVNYYYQSYFACFSIEETALLQECFSISCDGKIPNSYSGNNFNSILEHCGQKM